MVLSTGNAKAAAALFAESLELDGQVQQYRSAAIALAGAGHLDLSESILAGCQEPQLAALREAIRSYRQSAPPGYEKDAHVVAAMGDALSVVAAAKDPIVELAQPLTFARQDLLLAAHYWQAWMCCRAALAETDLTGRQMIVWRLEQKPSLIARGCIVQADSQPTSAAVLVHQGSRAAGLGSMEGMQDEAAAIWPLLTGQAKLYLASWAADSPPSVVVIEGRWEGEVFIATGTSDTASFGKLTLAVIDPKLTQDDDGARLGRGSKLCYEPGRKTRRQRPHQSARQYAPCARRAGFHHQRRCG